MVLIDALFEMPEHRRGRTGVLRTSLCQYRNVVLEWGASSSWLPVIGVRPIRRQGRVQVAVRPHAQVPGLHRIASARRPAHTPEQRRAPTTSACVPGARNPDGDIAHRNAGPRLQRRTAPSVNVNRCVTHSPRTPVTTRPGKPGQCATLPAAPRD